MKSTYSFWFIGLVLFAVACTASEAENNNTNQQNTEPTYTDSLESPTVEIMEEMEEMETPDATPTDLPTAVPTEAPTISLSPRDKIALEIQQEVANQLGIEITAVTIDSVTSAEWRDSSLGCPQEGMMYMQVLTSGYQVTVSANGQTFDYRANTRGRFFKCTQK